MQRCQQAASDSWGFAESSDACCVMYVAVCCGQQVSLPNDIASYDEVEG